MIDSEPKIKVALLQKCPEARMNLDGSYLLPDGRTVTGELSARAGNGQIILADSTGREIIRQKEVFLNPGSSSDAFFTVGNVKIGIDFHWQRTQKQSFRGALLLSMAGQNDFHLINVVPLEDYLASVISSEMSAKAPLEFLKTQAVTARSWLVAMLAKKKAPGQTLPRMNDKKEIIVWQDVNDHEGFDVCADDHCQRYQGITRIISENVARAIDATRGLFLVYDDEICDARYYKCCGGQTEIFSTAWENLSPAYLQSITDSDCARVPVQSEKDAADWLTSRPSAYCNTTDTELLGRILPAFDRETTHFYRWQLAYGREDLEAILFKKSGIDFGDLQHIIPLERGPSGRICRLKIIGSKKTVIVGKELEIRRWLSESHLLSSAFIVAVEHDLDGRIKRFIFHGGGWGHGVGLCQIGAAVMASQGYLSEKILAHYFRGTALKKLY
ncbi:MAG: SpoIID/LytB domain-containing protein [Smithellaceae bacterium]|nr:SpoIID/LytB domain-containing protein [Smithellaceae bacterium]